MGTGRGPMPQRTMTHSSDGRLTDSVGMVFPLVFVMGVLGTVGLASDPRRGLRPISGILPPDR